ncbi:hypothetical protein [Sphingopyxis sp.]|jgi:hypothetical protein|uniref:hypothetical protein n=2 Tax=Alphaproteobacteria TaxID=28211 RepID=UPI003F709255
MQRALDDDTRVIPPSLEKSLNPDADFSVRVMLEPLSTALKRRESPQIVICDPESGEVKHQQEVPAVRNVNIKEWHRRALIDTRRRAYLVSELIERGECGGSLSMTATAA